MTYPLRRAWLIFGRSGARRIPLTFRKKFFLLSLWAHLHNLMKQINNFSLLKKIENPPLNPLKILQQFPTIDNY